jgi:hypothetical protein
VLICSELWEYGVTGLDRQRHPDIRDRVKVNNQIEDIKLYQKSWLDHLERRDRSHLPKLAFQYQPRGRQNSGKPRKMWKDQEHLEL